jgi:hypothetical protein
MSLITKGIKRTDIVDAAVPANIRTIDIYPYLDTGNVSRQAKHINLRVDGASTSDVIVAFCNLADAQAIALAPWDVNGIGAGHAVAPGESIRFDIDKGVRYISMWCDTVGGTAIVRGSIVFSL